ncbi:MAG: glycosyltransferase [Chloroflexi bacterium]|nr:glycosyltransferase [Chloroflexota bacterium]
MDGLRIAVVSVHGCPLARLGEKDAGGMNVCIRELGRELGRRDLHVDVFTRWHDPQLAQVEELGPNARVIHLPVGDANESKEQLYPHLPQFLDHLLQFAENHDLSYQLIQSHYWLSGQVASWLRHQWRIPHVAMFHTLGEVKQRARSGEKEPPIRIETEKRVVASADCIIAATAHEKSQLTRLYEARPQKVAIIPCGVDLNRFRPLNKAEARQKLGLTNSKILLFVGRIEPFKGLDLLIETMAQIEDKCGLHLIIVGGDAHQDEIKRLRLLAQELGVAARVTFGGAVDHEKLPLYYNAADVCMIPSYHESFGMVALEALACGVPVIASRVGGLQDIVRDGETGYLIPWHCPEPFAERLELLIGNDTLRRNFSRAARASVEKFNWPVIADSILKRYSSLIEYGQTNALAFAANS